MSLLFSYQRPYSAPSVLQRPGYRSKKSRHKPKLGPYLERIAQIIEDDKAVSKKQRHTSKRIYERFKAEGYPGVSTQVKEAVRELSA